MFFSIKNQVEHLVTPNLSSGVSDQQSVGSSPSLDTCAFKKDTIPSLGWEVKLLVLCVLCNARKSTKLHFITKEKGFAPVFQWLPSAPQHLVNRSKVLHKWVSYNSKQFVKAH